MHGSRILRILLLTVNLLLMASLLLANTARFIDPNTLLFPAFFGLAFLPILLANILFALFWLVIRPSYLWFVGIVLTLSIPLALHHFQVSSGITDSGGDFKVVSYNVRLFDLYNWSHNTETRNDILNYLNRTDADILCLQEFFRSETPGYFNTLDTLKTTLRTKNLHEEFTGMLHRDRDKFGIATLTVFPIVGRGRVPLDTARHNIAIYTDIAIKGDTVRVFNLHLASIHLSELEKDIDAHIRQNQSMQQWRDVKQLVMRLSGGFQRRARQANVIAEHIASSPYPVIVCGDLNDTPASYAYQQLSSSLHDAFRERGKGLGSTYIGFFPSFRIDYLLHDDALHLHHFKTEDVRFSDHRPLVGGFSLSE